MNISNKTSAATQAVSRETAPAHRTYHPPARQPGNEGRPTKPQPRRHWLAAIFTAFALLTAGGAHAQTAPVVTITKSATGDYTNGTSAVFTITFDEAITGFDVSDGDLSGAGDVITGGDYGPATIMPPAVAATTYQSTQTFTLTVDLVNDQQDGELTITVPADAVTSTATSTGNLETSVTQMYDNVVPVFTAGATATAAVGDPVSTVVYTAIATDNGVADTSITYTLGTDADSMMFGIDATTGALTYLASPAAVGDTDVMITATDKGGNAATITVTVTVSKGEQADFGFADSTVDKMPTDDKFTVAATGGSGTGTVVYSSGTEATATVDGATGEVTIVAAGVTTITATKAADDNYNVATDSYILIVGTPTPVVTITDDVTAEYAADTVTFTLSFSETITGFGDSYSAVGGLTPTITPVPNTATTYTSTDTFTITSGLNADTNDGELIVTVGAGEVTSVATGEVNVFTEVTQKYDNVAPVFTSDATTAMTFAAGDPASTVAYTAVATDGGDALTYSLGTGSNAMTFNIDANTGEVRYNVSPTTVRATREVEITATDKGGNSVMQTVNFPVIQGVQPDFGFAEPTVNKIPTDANFTETATGGFGTGAVTYTSSDTAVATVVSGTGEVDIIAFGSTTITATSAGDANNAEATDTYTLYVGTTHPVASGSVTLRVDDTITEVAAAAAAVNAPPMGIEFSLTTDLTLTTDLALTTTTTLAVDATVCLSTTGVPAGRNAVLYHYESLAWDDISTASTSTLADHVCGETDTFSPFAVGYYAPGTLLESLDLGTVEGVNLNLILPVTTASGKTYYYLDLDENNRVNPGVGGGDANDYATNDMLDALLNGGANTIATQEGTHDGGDDARSEIIGEYTLILPTAAELRVFANDPAFTGRTGLNTVRTGTGSSIRAADFLVRSAGEDGHNVWNLGVADIQDIADDSVSSYTFFQVLPAPATADQALTFDTAIPNQTYLVGSTDISFTLPTASGGISPLSYTLTRRLSSRALPGGFTFDPAVPAISSGMITSESTTTELRELLYTVTDARLAVASLTFTVNTVTVNVDTAAGETVGYLDGVITATNIGGGVDGDNKNDMRLSLPESLMAQTFTVTTYTPSADMAPDGVTFSDKAMDIALTGGTLTADATVCLSTDGVPERSTSAIYRLPTATDTVPNPNWVALTPATTLTISDFVCGTTADFSPFAVGYGDPPVVTFVGTIEDQIYQVGETVALTLPTATAADTMGMPSYTLTPIDSIPDGLIFDAVARTLAGIPTTVTPLVTLAYTAIDDTDVMAAPLTFTVEVVPGSNTLTRLNEQILTRASQAMTASTMAAVAARVDAVADGVGASVAGTTGAGATPTLAYQLGGQSSLRGLLESHGKAMLEGEMEYERLLDGASFVLPLSATDGNNQHGVSNMSLWGATADYRSLDGDEDGLDWNGDVRSFHFGIDGQFSQQIMAGIALSLNESSFDYTDTATGSGEYQYRSTNLHPYIGWYPTDDWKLWATLGYGQGEIENEVSGIKDSTDSAQLSLSGGFNKRLSNSARPTSWNLKGDVSLVQVAVDKGDSFVSEDIDSQRLRLLVSGEQDHKTTSGGVLTPSLEVGVRSDGGDGENGTGAELGGGLRYSNSGGDFTP